MQCPQGFGLVYNPAVHTPFLLTDTNVRHLGEGEALQFDDFASNEEVEDWSQAIACSQADFSEGRTGATHTQDNRVRTDRRAWESDLPGRFLGMRERFVEVSTELNAAAWMGLAGFSIQLAAFEPGGHYQAHRDALRGDKARRVTAILYLNSEWKAADGGCLRVHSSGKSLDIEPRGGRLVVFLSDRLLHEVLPGRAVRHAATAWFRGYDRP
ncbi:MAG: SM-20-related protein [Cognaticolwellia sp.]|jgi:SM-20-related protein